MQLMYNKNDYLAKQSIFVRCLMSSLASTAPPPPPDPRRPLQMLYMFIATCHCPKGIMGLGGKSSKNKLKDTRGVFNNVSARSAIECFLPERKRSPRCLQALAIQVDRCIARKSKMATKTIMGFR